MDHPADVIVHGWGKDKKTAFENAVLGMYNYLTPLSGIEMTGDVEISVDGAEDEKDLLYKIMDECLFNFSTEFFVCKEFTITEMTDSAIKATGRGETFVRGKHEPGTEIKAITMHNMRIHDQSAASSDEPRVDVYVTVDI